ncbi:hypothetical protein GEMRC1_008815 [Eukaryota sp. GEM-RC1]
MIVRVLLLICSVLGSVSRWNAAADGLWSESSNWEPTTIPSILSSVVLPRQTAQIIVTIGSNVTISSLTISTNIVVHFNNCATLHVSNDLFFNGGTLLTDSSTPCSSASTESLHWIQGELTFVDILDFENLFLYGDSKTWPQNSLVIENELYFNNSLTFSISHLNLNFLSTTCFPGSELIIDSPPFDDTLMDVNDQLHIMPDCSLSLHVPVQCRRVITIGRNSVLTLNKDSTTTGSIVVLPKGEMVLRNCTITFEGSGPYLDPDLFLYYNWVTSSNRLDLSGNHDSTEIFCHGQMWKTDTVGGYLEVKRQNTLRIPNIPGEFGWRDATISVWLFFEDELAAFGFDLGWTCNFFIRRFGVSWGNTFHRINLPRRDWFHLVVTLTQSGGRIYVDGEFRESFNAAHPYRCSSHVPSYFPLSQIAETDVNFSGNIRAIQIFTKVLTLFEINLLTLYPNVRVWGPGKLSIVDSQMTISRVHFAVDLISLESSTVYLDNYSPQTELKWVELSLSELHYDESGSEAELIIDVVYFQNTSSIVTSASTVISQFHWFEGELFSSRVLSLKRLFLYGTHKTIPPNSLIVENELYFNNSLSVSIFNTEFNKVSVTCRPGFELIVDFSSDEAVLKIQNLFNLTSSCSFTSLVPIQSSGVIGVANYSTMTLHKDLSTTSVVVILSKGELILKNSTITFEGSDPYLHPDLFLYYNWVSSFNRFDISRNHFSSAILIDGPEWKTDDFGGYLDIKQGNTLGVPNLVGEYGWTDASISLWIYFEEGAMGFDLYNAQACRFVIYRDRIRWGWATHRISFPLAEWFHLVISIDQSKADIFVDGTYRGSADGYRFANPFICRHAHPSRFLLSGVTSSSDVFYGRIRAVQIINTYLTALEVNLLFIELNARIWGPGKLSIIDSKMMIAPNHFRIQMIALFSSIVYLEHSPPIELNSIELHLSELIYDVSDSGVELLIESVYLNSTSSIITSGSFTVLNFHWYNGEFHSCDYVTLKINHLYLYGESKTLHPYFLIIETELYFNNSLTFSIFHLTLNTVSVSCFPASELILDSPSFNESIFEITSQFQLSSFCSFTSLLPVQSTGIVEVANDSLMTLYKDFWTNSVIQILHDGELVLRNITIVIEGSDTYIPPELFLYYNWATSSNKIDLAGNHDPSAIIIDGPEWKTDLIGGYLDVKPGNTLHIPNIPGPQGWRDASISMWIYMEEGGMGFSMGSLNPCRFIIRTNAAFWGIGSHWYSLPRNEWFHLVIITTQQQARLYVDGYFTVTVSTNPYYCARTTPSVFKLSEIDSDSGFARFKGRLRAVQVFRRTLTTVEINALSFFRSEGIWGRGKLSVFDMKPTFPSKSINVEQLSLVSSVIYLEHAIPMKLNSIELLYSRLYYDEIISGTEICIETVYIHNTSSIITDATLTVINCFWFDGELSYSNAFYIKRLFVYSNVSSLSQHSLVIEEEFFFNNSITFTICHLTTVNLSVVCHPGSEVNFDPLYVSGCAIDVQEAIYLSSGCALTSLLPVQSTGVINVANDSVMTLSHVLNEDGAVFVRSKGVLILNNYTNTFGNSDLYFPPDAFVYYNWIYSLNRNDLSGNHDHNAILFDGPQWKTDELGGYLEVGPHDNLRIPYIGGATAWRDASISLWISFESGGFGFASGGPERMFISDRRSSWGSSSSTYGLPRNRWIYLVMTFDQTRARLYVDGILKRSFGSSPYYHSKPPTLFPLSEITDSSTRFRGKIRAVQIYSHTLSISEIHHLSHVVYQGIFGQGHVSLLIQM